MRNMLMHFIAYVDDCERFIATMCDHAVEFISHVF